ncbi:MAG: hydantoinase/oxoprolinase family protein [Deltaproteobacteria bacterium]|nr:hydantoinase/oxoprolinase family protein [Deltaproteobacteria bacterium]
MKLIGVDTGGTFTDLVLMDEQGRVRVHKAPSTPDNPSRAVWDGLAGLVGESGMSLQVVHGSTVATNAILERKGARTALITTAGFEDVLEIGRQNRPGLYDLEGKRPRPLVDRDLRLGLNERILFDGRVEQAAGPDEISDLLSSVKAAGAQSLAVCLLHAYANPVHENMVREQARTLGLPVSVSHRVLNEFREYERTSTTVVNAYVAPLMARYLEKLEQRLGPKRLRIMQSNGGSVSVSAVKEKPVRTVLSGPAGGVCGAGIVAGTAGLERFISFDMGGTSTDVSLYDRGVQITTESFIGGCPVKVPMIRIHTVGAGGGSIARADAGGALAVGPQSAGADPGPVCYGRGEEITVTDANLFLGRLDPNHFLGGRMRIHADRVGGFMDDLARKLKLSAERTAEGVVQVVNAAMEKALRVISVERGYDPREFTMVSFGGGGGLHACELARSLGLPRVLVPPNPGVLSALGMVLSDVVIDSSRTVMIPTESTGIDLIEERFSPLVSDNLAEMESEGFAREDVLTELFLDMRYQGQSYEITVPFTNDFAEQFHRFHHRLYGTMNLERPTEIVTLRVRLTGLRPKPDLLKARGAGKEIHAAVMGRKPVLANGEWSKAVLFDRALLEPGHKFHGPSLIMEFSSTTYVPEGFRFEVDPMLNLILEPDEVSA